MGIVVVRADRLATENARWAAHLPVKMLMEKRQDAEEKGSPPSPIKKQIG
jgi:hypothetical protein